MSDEELTKFKAFGYSDFEKSKNGMSKLRL